MSASSRTGNCVVINHNLMHRHVSAQLLLCGHVCSEGHVFAQLVLEGHVSAQYLLYGYNLVIPNSFPYLLTLTCMVNLIYQLLSQLINRLCITILS